MLAMNAAGARVSFVVCRMPVSIEASLEILPRRPAPNRCPTVIPSLHANVEVPHLADFVRTTVGPGTRCSKQGIVLIVMESAGRVHVACGATRR